MKGAAMRNVITAVLIAMLLTGCSPALAENAAANTFVVNNQAAGASDTNPGTDAKPLDITFDFYGKPIDPKKVLPGPFQGIEKGDNTLKIRPPINP